MCNYKVGIISTISIFVFFRKLSAENRKLCTDVEKEINDKKRISMENEELQWKMRQSLDHGNSSGLMSMSVIEGNF
jgi:hypothetical protein